MSMKLARQAVKQQTSDQEEKDNDASNLTGVNTTTVYSICFCVHTSTRMSCRDTMPFATAHPSHRH